MEKRLLHLLIGLAVWTTACHKDTNTTADSANSLPIDSLLALSANKFTTAPDSAYLYARKAYKIATEENMPKALAKSQWLMGKAYFQQGRFNAAIQSLLAALKGFEQLGNREELVMTANLLGRVYQQTEQFSEALMYYNAALTASQQANKPPLTAHTFGNIGHFYEKQQSYDSALLYQYKALDLLVAWGDSSEMSLIYDNIGSIYEDLSQYEEAFPYFWKAYQFSKGSGNLNESIINLNNLGDVYRKRSLYDSALFYTQMALNEAKAANNRYQIRSSYRDLSKLYRDMGDFENAHRYQEFAYDLNGEIYSSQIATELAGTRAVYELEEKERRIQLLEKDRRLERVYLFGISTIALLVAIIGILLFLQQKQRTKKNLRLYDAENELNKAELLNAQLNEQNLKSELENKQLREEQLHRELEIKSRSMTKNALHVIQKNEFLETLKADLKAIRKGDEEEIVKKVRKLEKSIDLNFNLDDDWQEFETVFQQVHASFFHALQQQYPDLTPTELRLCAMIRLNLNSKDISTIMGISQDSLRISRYRLRKKLNLDKGSNLYSFIMHIG